VTKRALNNQTASGEGLREAPGRRCHFDLMQPLSGLVEIWDFVTQGSDSGRQAVATRGLKGETPFGVWE
jgi:hypothetical protein